MHVTSPPAMALTAIAIAFAACCVPSCDHSKKRSGDAISHEDTASDSVADGAEAVSTDTGVARDTLSADSSRDSSVDSSLDASVDSSVDGTNPDSTTTPPSAERLFGVTITDPWVADAEPSELTRRLDGLAGPDGRLPTARVVFDEGVDRVFATYGTDASAYVDVVQNIAAHATVMGELLDSLYVGGYGVQQYRARACEYRATLGHLVDIWEIGNEVNGEWLGDQLTEKLAVATEVFTANADGFASLCPGFSLRPDERSYAIALTLYYNGTYNGGVASSDNCWASPSHAMQQWLLDNFVAPGAVGTEAIAPHLDYVLVSYYEDDCEGIQPEWSVVFDDLAEVFPNAGLGMGECGTTIAADKPAYADRYYLGVDSTQPSHANMHVEHPRFVGGYFWWYFSEDMTNEAFYSVLVNALASAFWAP